jgi:fluoroacetyl-CoA thioesterase
LTELTPGLRGERKMTVNEVDTASRWGSGLVPVFSTPALVGLMESAAVAALEDRLLPGKTSVGTHMDLRHLAATPVGMNVRAEAELITVEERKLHFKIQAWDERELIGKAEHERFIVDEERFMKRVQGKLLEHK